MHELPDDSLADILPVVKRVASAVGATSYNVLNNNGKPAHQEVPHVHFHMIPKPDEKSGLGIGWRAQSADKEELNYFEELKQKL